MTTEFKSLKCKRCGWEGNEWEMNSTPLKFSEDGESATFRLICPDCDGDKIVAQMKASDLKGWIMSQSV